MHATFPECQCFEAGSLQRRICENDFPGKPLHGPNSVNAFRAKWGKAEIHGPPPPPASVPTRIEPAIAPKPVRDARERGQYISVPCVYRGAKLRDDTSNLCGSRGHLVSIYSCSNSKTPGGECSIGRYCRFQKAQSCFHCDHRDQFRRHLIGHLYPRRGNWRWNVEELLKRIDIFNGTRSIGIVTDDTTDSAEEVKQAFAGSRIDRWIELPNNPKQREGVTFFALMDGLPRGQEDLTWYWHGKSAQYGGGITRHWADAQHRIMLDGWRDVQESLTDYPITGAFKRRDGWQMPRAGQWHYTGTAFAFRNADVFSRHWRRLSRYFFCVEFWPPMLFHHDEAGCVFGDGARDLYKPENWTEWNRQLEAQFGLNSVAEIAIAGTAG